MKQAFTLIELLVVIVILVIVMAVVAPKGAKMLNNFEKSVNATKERQKLSKERSKSFLEAKERTLNILDANYSISSKGVLTKIEKSNDNY